MFASLNCMHSCWKNYPIIWWDSFTNKYGNKSIILEAVTNQRSWIWHEYFKLPRCNNDLNVLDRSLLIWDLLEGVGVDLNFKVDSNVHPHYYLLAIVNGIYPWWSCFVSTIHEPQRKKHQHNLSEFQETNHKNVKYCLSVL
jgi:hypothetical protein